MNSTIFYPLLKMLFSHREEFLSMGYGIEARYARCAAYWEPHLRCSKEFIRSVFPIFEEKKVSILGAGRLLDIDALLLTKTAKELLLFDADPSVLGRWARLWIRHPFKVKGVLADLTQALDQWKHSAPVNADEPRVLQWLKTLNVPEVSFPGEVLISLNLLSQLPIYWRDWVQEKVFQGRESAKGDALLSRLGTRMIEAHLKGINNSSAEEVILLFDRYFFYYRSDVCSWQVEEAVEVSVEKYLKNFELKKKDSWLWHLAPQGIESEEYGEIHEVHAHFYQRKKRVFFPPPSLT